MSGDGEFRVSPGAFVLAGGGLAATGAAGVVWIGIIAAVVVVAGALIMRFVRRTRRSQ